jgi:hypothetical protein
LGLMKRGLGIMINTSVGWIQTHGQNESSRKAIFDFISTMFPIPRKYRVNTPRLCGDQTVFRAADYKIMAGIYSGLIPYLKKNPVTEPYAQLWLLTMAFISAIETKIAPQVCKILYWRLMTMLIRCGLQWVPTYHAMMHLANEMETHGSLEWRATDDFEKFNKVSRELIKYSPQRRLDEWLVDQGDQVFALSYHFHALLGEELSISALTNLFQNKPLKSSSSTVSTSILFQHQVFVEYPGGNVWVIDAEPISLSCNMQAFSTCVSNSGYLTLRRSESLYERDLDPINVIHGTFLSPTHFRFALFTPGWQPNSLVSYAIQTLLEMPLFS